MHTNANTFDFNSGGCPAVVVLHQSIVNSTGCHSLSLSPFFHRHQTILNTHTANTVAIGQLVTFEAIAAQKIQ